MVIVATPSDCGFEQFIHNVALTKKKKISIEKKEKSRFIGMGSSPRFVRHKVREESGASQRFLIKFAGVWGDFIPDFALTPA